jgi:ferredoxin
MKDYIISPGNLERFIAALGRTAPVYAPSKMQGGDVLYTRIDEPGSILPSSMRPSMPAVREFLFSQSLEMMAYRKSSGATAVETIDTTGDLILLGVPACDLEGILYCDHFFKGREFSDYYYASARSRLTLIGLVCLTPPELTCFCGSMREGGAHALNGYDLQLTAITGGYFVEVGSEKGEQLAAASRDLFGESSPAYREEAKRLWDRAKNLSTGDVPPVDETLDAFASQGPDDTFFEDYAARCISCGGCNYVCPTCTCFNVMDRGDAQQGVRSRVMDSCIFSGYYRMAGRHVPRATMASRTAQRYFCKFPWDRIKFGMSGCTGCGRCVESCPVNIDIRDLMKHLVTAGGSHE